MYSEYIVATKKEKCVRGKRIIYCMNQNELKKKRTKAKNDYNQIFSFSLIDVTKASFFAIQWLCYYVLM